MNLQETCRAIRELRIQGAENVATEAVVAVRHVLRQSRAKTVGGVMRDLSHARDLLVATRPTEPELRNYLRLVIGYARGCRKQDVGAWKRDVIGKVTEVLEQKQIRLSKIIENGVLLLERHARKRKVVVYTHCHSSTVTLTLREAQKRVSIQVRNTETRPLYQGRKTATELAVVGIPVIYHVDGAMVEALREADLALIGADAVTKDGVYNKIGSELLGILATHYNIPLYVCCSFGKFDPKREVVEQRSPDEVWERRPKNVGVHNPAFELLHFRHIKGIVCEDGVLQPKVFLRRVRKVLASE